jgi:inhibitor of KinA
MYDALKILPAGDQALVVEFGDTIEPEANRMVRELDSAIEALGMPGVLETVPTYRSLLVQYDPVKTSFDEILSRFAQLVTDLDEQSVGTSRVVRIPTLYGGEAGPDLEYVAEHAGIGTGDVIQIHSGTDYLVYMMGFSPGFPYLGGLSDLLTTPRLTTPRAAVPVGSVGIAETQTGVYPVTSPGGWRIIGRTPVRLFDPEASPPALLRAGDYLRFVPLESEDSYQQILGRVERGEYRVVTEEAK